MLPLYVLFAQAMVHLIRLVRTHGAWVRATMGVFAAGYLLMNAGLEGADFRAPDSNLRMTHGGVTGGPQYMVRIIFGGPPFKKE
jgi:hypothetical protein